jgi:hypothetical protein
MKTLKQRAGEVLDKLESVRSTKSRAGDVVERGGKMLEAKVPPAEVAEYMTMNSTNGNTYSAAEMPTVSKIYQDSKSKPLITKAQAKTSIKKAKATGAGGDIPDGPFVPA